MPSTVHRPPPAVFSIITVVYNGAFLLPGTIESVRRQTYPFIEYLVIDGGSTDGTVDIIRKYAAEMPNLRWISEKDRGLYDAMNKGLRLATGDFVWFLNSGDHLHAPDTVEKLAQMVSPETDVLYGETLLVEENRKPLGLMGELSTRSLPPHLHWRNYLGGMLVVHQSFVARRVLAPAYMDGNLCADFDWCIRILKESRQTVNSGLILSDYLAGGISKKRHRQSLSDRFAVMRTHFGLVPTLLAHAWIAIRAAAHRVKRWGKERY
ncbi:MAG: glycosyltransferase [Thermoanaerobaculia bacterium]|nr:glycosyltransferase [Thermoanaerobaculia bacterium]